MDSSQRVTQQCPPRLTFHAQFSWLPPQKLQNFAVQTQHLSKQSLRKSDFQQIETLDQPAFESGEFLYWLM